MNSPATPSSDGIRTSGSSLAIDFLLAGLPGPFPAQRTTAITGATCAIMRRARSPRPGGMFLRKKFRIVTRAAWWRRFLFSFTLFAAALPQDRQAPSDLLVTHHV